MTDIYYPFRISGRGRVDTAGEEDHVYQMIEQLLFTSPGERVNRPDFGTGVMQLVFAPNSDELAAATEFMIQSALQQYLGDLILPETVSVESDEARLTIVVQYVLRQNQQRRMSTFTRAI